MATNASDLHNHLVGCCLITRMTTVRPKLSRTETVLRISNLDRQCPTLMYLLFFYERNEFSATQLFDSLRGSLEETLEVWYPAAGRLMTSNSEATDEELQGKKLKLNLLCNNAGAMLVESTTTLKISELGDLSRYNKFFEKLVHRPRCGGSISQMPLVVAQVTGFGCGGYSIGIGTSHSLFDGPAALDFICSWSTNSSMTMENQDFRSRKPVFERGRLLITNSENPTNRPETTAAIEHMHMLINQAAADQEGGEPDMRWDDYILQTFHISGAQLERLKKKKFNEKSTTWTSFEVVSAHLWKARTRALGINKGKSVCLQFAVDARSRMVPPLPKSFAGNAYVLASVAMTAGTLEEASYDEIAKKIREAKDAVTNDYVKSYIEALEGSEATTLPLLEELTIISDWTRMPFHKVEFMTRRADYVSPLVAPVPYVAYLMQNPDDSTAVDVRIGLRPETASDFAGCFRFAE